LGEYVNRGHRAGSRHLLRKEVVIGSWKRERESHVTIAIFIVSVIVSGRRRKEIKGGREFVN
jgi:hypothetical protein